MTDVVAAQLLSALRDHLGQPDLEYVGEPKKLTGGYYTDNRSFRIAANDPAWAVPLVLRLFPREGPPEQVRREALVQRALTAQGYSAPHVLWWEDDVDVLGRRFLVMELLPGRTPLGGAEIGAVLRALPWLLLRMPKALAQVQAELHRVPPSAFTASLDGLPAGVERWLDYIDDAVTSRTPELRDAAEWLRANRPPESRTAICHGDLWPGNLLLQDGRVRAVLDWSLATVADPAFDVGFTAMSLSIAPIQVGPRLGAIVTWNARWMCGRYVKAYTKLTGADLTAQPYYEALRCALELVHVVEHRHAQAEGVERDTPAPTWDVATERMTEYFEVRTGVRIELPPRVIRS